MSNTPTKNEIITTIIDAIDIRGIDLNLYKDQFENSLYNAVCSLFNVKPIKELKFHKIIDWSTIKRDQLIYHGKNPKLVYKFISQCQSKFFAKDNLDIEYVFTKDNTPWYSI